MNRFIGLLWLSSVAFCGVVKRQEPDSALDRYIDQVSVRDLTVKQSESGGSLWSPQAPLGDLARDPRAYRVDDLVTIVVSDRASATSKGTTQTARKSATKTGIGSLWGVTRPQLTDLAQATNETTLDGQGTTSRETVLSTTVSARVVRVLPNGNLVLEGSKETAVNSERQLVTVRGVIRPNDLSPDNLVRSDRLAMLEIKVNGKGVVGDAIRRPMFLYRLLLGLLPF